MSEKKVSQLNSKTVLESVESWFSDAVSSDNDWKDRSKVWYEYYHGTQWTAEEVAALEERGQAVTTFNHIKPTVDAVIGGERQNRPKTRMAGRTLDDQQVAEVKTRLYDYIQYDTGSDDEIDKALLDVLVTGRGFVMIEPSMVGKEFDNIAHEYVDTRDMFIDPLSKRDDLEDARYIHHAVYLDADIIQRNFKKFKAEEGNVSSQPIAGFESSSEDELWFEKGNRNRPRLIQTWYRDEKNEIATVIWVKGQMLYFKEKPYTLNRFPYACTTLNRDLENKPYGMVKSMISGQDEVNKRHSKALHYLNTRQVLAEEDAFVEWTDAEKTLAKPDGVTKLNEGALASGKVQVQDNTALAQAHITMMEIAKAKILETAGLNAGMVGQSGQYESAKKNGQNIQQAQNVLVPFLNKVRTFRYDIACITMKLVPDFYTSERLVRIVEPNGNYAFQPINKMQLLDDGTIIRMNDMSTDDVDVIIEDAPSSLSEQDEQYQMLLQIQGQTGQPIPMHILLRYSKLKDKHQLAKDLEMHNNLQSQLQQAQGYVQQLEQQVQQLGGQINQQQSQLVQVNTAREVEKEVNKQKDKLGL